MPSVNLAAYLLKIKPHRVEEFQCIRDFSDGEDVYNLLTEFMDLRKSSPTKDDDVNKYLRVEDYSQDEDVIYGTFKSGEYGIVSDLVNTDSNIIAHHRTKTEAELIPLYFCLYLPPGERTGIAIFQKYGNVGVKGIFTSEFTKYFNDHISKHTFMLKPLARADYAKYLLDQGRFVNIEFTEVGLGSNIEDSFLSGTPDDSVKSTTVTIKAKRDRNLRRLFGGRVGALLDGEIELDRVVEISEFKYSTCHLNVEMDGKKRKITLPDFGNLSPSYDISNEIEPGADGFPTFESVHKASTEIMSDFISLTYEQKNESKRSNAYRRRLLNH